MVTISTPTAEAASRASRRSLRVPTLNCLLDRRSRPISTKESLLVLAIGLQAIKIIDCVKNCFEKCLDPHLRTGYGRGMEQEPLAVQLCNKTTTHKEWLALMSFGMGTLLGDQEILVECIFAEANREKERGNKKEVTFTVVEIFDELELKIEGHE